MAELDTLAVLNPTKKDFKVNFNGEPYEVAAEAEKAFPEFLAFHIAKHMSDDMLSDEVAKIRKKESDNPYRPQIGQLLVYDNAKRRIALHKILRSKEKVEACINAYPFKSFIGEMTEYDEYVKTKETKSEKPEEASKDK